MGINSRRIKDRAIELSEGYEDAMDDKFNDEFTDFLKTCNFPQEQITQDDIQGFMDSFTTPDEMDWAFEQVDNELADIGDQKYQEWKERDI